MYCPGTLPTNAIATSLSKPSCTDVQYSSSELPLFSKYAICPWSCSIFNCSTCSSMPPGSPIYASLPRLSPTTAVIIVIPLPAFFTCRML